MTPRQLIFVRKLLNREGLAFAEEEYAMVYSNNRVKDLAELTYAETQNIIAAFVKPSSADKMRRKILSMAHEMHWETSAGAVDMQRVNAWCNKHTASHCDFNAISLKELPKVVSVFEKMYKTFLKQL